jgi:uncharacterized membrane protein
MWKNRYLRVAITGILLLISLIPASAQSRSVFWQRWDVEIDNINTAGNSFDVAEIYDIYFTGTFRFGSAVIPNTNLESISNIRVYEAGQVLERSCSERPGTYCVENVEEGTSIVYYFFDPITDDSQTFELRYTVNGALRVYEGGDQLWWIAVPAEKYGFSVGESTITVGLPEGYAPREGIDPVVTYGVAGDVQVNGTQVVATALDPIGPNDTFEIRVQYPHNPNARVTGWQAGFDTRRQIQPVIDIVMIGLGLLIGIGGPLGVFYLWYSRGRDPKVGPVPEYLSELPADLPPAIVGTLLDEKADLRDVLSTLIDLSHRGYIVIEENRKEGFFGLGGGSEFTFKRTDKPIEGLRSYENRLVGAIFNHRMERSLDALKNKFYVHIPQLQNDLYQEVVNEGLFRDNPNSVRTGWSMLGIVLVMAAFGVGYLSFAALETLSQSLLCLPFSIGLTGVALIIVGQYLPAKTRKGAEEAAKWNAFRQYLEKAEKYKPLEEAAANFDRYLPYAVAFGMERSWLRKFSRIDTMPIPTWYYPTYRGGYWSRGYTPGTPLGRGLPSAGDVLPGELATAGGSGGLNDLAGGLTGGLESLSSGLTSMLNSAGSVMTSRPQSSGSWSSGGRGFSGGGSFGGGGSGGGSRGFG